MKLIHYFTCSTLRKMAKRGVPLSGRTSVIDRSTEIYVPLYSIGITYHRVN